jgi:hypothetical protein
MAAHIGQGTAACQPHSPILAAAEFGESERFSLDTPALCDDYAGE